MSQRLAGPASEDIQGMRLSHTIGKQVWQISAASEFIQCSRHACGVLTLYTVLEPKLISLPTLSLTSWSLLTSLPSTVTDVSLPRSCNSTAPLFCIVFKTKDRMLMRSAEQGLRTALSRPAACVDAKIPDHKCRMQVSHRCGLRSRHNKCCASGHVSP